jgi:predicted nucleic acid-binding Zn ribbon protein
MKDKPLAKCKFCGGKVERLISAGAGLIFKGSGFYATDYRRKNDSHKLKESAPPTCPAENPSCHNCPKAKDGK